MTTTGPVFDPARSAALRDILHETVAAAPRRDSRTRFAVLGGLIGAALLLAGGTAALALSGALHFGGPEPAPAPAPTTSTPSATPTPTPTQTPSTPRVEVKSGLIVPEDVDSLPTQPRWTLALPGLDDGCRILPTSYDINEGLAVFVSGARPKEYEGGSCATGSTRDEKIGLTMVDTTDGEVIWQRTWEYVSDPANGAQITRLTLLGTSGRALFTSTDDVAGAHDVIDLATGATLGTFDPEVMTYGVPVPGLSGDVILTTNAVDTGTGRATVSRVDPLDPAHPRWSTSLDTAIAGVAGASIDPDVLPLTYSAAGSNARVSATVALADGTVTVHPELTEFRSVAGGLSLWGVQAADGSWSDVALGNAGERLWSRPAPPGSMIVPLSSPGARPGFTTGDGGAAEQLVAVDSGSISLLDAQTGDEVWRTDLSGCGAKSLYGVPYAYEDAARDAVTVRFPQDRICSFDAATGRLLPNLGLPVDAEFTLGSRNVYVSEFGSADGAAYDAATGTRLWTAPHPFGESWEFAGGRLVRTSGNTVGSIG